MVSRFPDYFPDNFESLLPENVEYARKRAYRLALYGVNNPDSYLPTIRSDQIEHINRNKKVPLVYMYSISCFSTLRKIKELKATTFKKKPKAEIAVGSIEPEHGPTLTEASGHIHWWIYKNVHAESFFGLENDNDE